MGKTGISHKTYANKAPFPSDESENKMITSLLMRWMPAVWEHSRIEILCIIYILCIIITLYNINTYLRNIDILNILK